VDSDARSQHPGPEYVPRCLASFILVWISDICDVRPMVFLDDLATNATAHDVSIIIYSGNDDALIPHRGSEGTCYLLLIRLMC